MKALIVEDSTTLCAIYEAYLSGLGLEIHAVTSLTEAKKSVVLFRPDFVLLDIELPDGNGLDLISELDTVHPKPVSIVMTGHGSEWAERALAKGAADFLAKPFDSIRLRVTVQNAMRRKELNDRIEVLSDKRGQLGGLVGSSPLIRAVYDAVERIAAADGTVLITGESGTGKELAARAVHDLSARAPEPFIVFDCAAISGDAIERELFGEDPKESSTGWIHRGLVARANGGTLFLDEIGELDYAAQSLLLRFLESGVFRSIGSDRETAADVRVIAATNRDPLEEVRARRLREDLYYRLQVFPIRLPALRERLDDVPVLAALILNRLSTQTGKTFNPLSDDAKRRLSSYAWPGNVRQLENMLRWMTTMLVGSDIDASIIEEAIAQFDDSPETAGTPVKPRAAEPAAESEIKPLWLVEKEAIQNAIEASDGNINRAASLLEVAPSTIYRKMQAWNEGDS
ncbi:MAG: response regulator [Gammaproteobacteria bacterium]|nr:response regulator [Gammaproteobacteria bacterium]